MRGPFLARHTYESYGVTFGLEVPDTVNADSLTPMLPFNTTTIECPAESEFQLQPIQNSDHWNLYQDGIFRAWAPSYEYALERLESTLQLHVADYCTTHAFVHAGCVRIGNTVVIIPGGSHAGKSTLVYALVEAGAEYYSDEFVLITSDGSIHPFPRPLSLRKGPFGPQRRVNIESQHPADRSGTDEVLVIKCEYQAGCIWDPRPMSITDMMFSLVSNSVSIRRQPAMVMQAFGACLGAASGFTGKRGEVEEVVAWIDEHQSKRRT